MSVDPAAIVTAFTKTVREDTRNRIVTNYLVKQRRFDGTDQTFHDALHDLYETQRNDPPIRHTISRLNLPEDRQFLAPWAALIAYYTSRPLWPLAADVTKLIDRAYDELCAEGHIIRSS